MLSLMSIPRRALLKYGLGGAGLLTLGGVGLALQGSVLRAPNAPLQALDPVEYSVLFAVADRVCPGQGAHPAAHAIDVAGAVDALLATLDPATTGEIKLLLRLLENALPGALLDGRVRPFTACSPEQQDATLAAWQHSAILVRRAGYKVLRALCASTYYADPRSFAGSGYPGPPDFSAALAAQEAG
jgi:hypothetical protein